MIILKGEANYFTFFIYICKHKNQNIMIYFEDNHKFLEHIKENGYVELFDLTSMNLEHINSYNELIELLPKEFSYDS